MRDLDENMEYSVTDEQDTNELRGNTGQLAHSTESAQRRTSVGQISLLSLPP
jgi:hypothetical protein